MVNTGDKPIGSLSRCMRMVSRHSLVQASAPGILARLCQPPQHACTPLGVAVGQKAPP